MKKQKKCYIYTRVSTAIQVDGYSLDAQKDKEYIQIGIDAEDCYRIKDSEKKME